MYLAIFITCPADVLDSITEMEIQSLVSNKIPNIAGTSLIVGGTFGHFLIKLVIEFPSTKFCFCKAIKKVIISYLSVSGMLQAAQINLSLRTCSGVNCVIGGGGP